MSDLKTMLMYGKVGIQDNEKGAITPIRFSKTGALVNSPGHAAYAEAVARGNCFIACNQTGVTTQAGLAVTTPALTLYNPVNSGKLGVLIYAGFIMSVACAAAAAVWLAGNVNPSAAAVTGTAASVSNCQVGNGAMPALKCFTAATLPAAPTGLAILGVGLTGAITTIPNMTANGRYFDGAIQVYPGGAISFQTSTASGAAGFFGEFVWEEMAL